MTTINSRELTKNKLIEVHSEFMSTKSTYQLKNDLLRIMKYNYPNPKLFDTFSNLDLNYLKYFWYILFFF